MCGKKILWAKTKNNKNIPVDFLPKNEKEIVKRYGKKTVKYDADTMTCHLQTCKERAKRKYTAGKYRRKVKPGYFVFYMSYGKIVEKGEYERL